MVTQSKSLTLDKAEAETIVPLVWNDVDLSGMTVTFKVKNGFELTAVQHPTIPTAKQLVFTQAHSGQLSTTPKEFLLMVGGSAFRGTINATGWKP